MSKAILTKGIQASGKSTFAKTYCEKNHDWVRINRDDLRYMRGKYWLPKQEDLITDWEYSLIETAIDSGYNVIVDDMNLNPKFTNRLLNFLKEMGVTDIEWKDFTSTPLEVCIERDRIRLNSIGEKVIRQTYEKYLAPKIEPVKQDFNLPHIIISDLDGTLALFGNKNPYERDFISDELNEDVARLLYNYIGAENTLGSQNCKLIIVSGRSAKYQEETEKWLKLNNISYSEIFMRKEGDSRKDFVVKKEIFDAHIKDKYYVHMIVDDRLQVCRLWYQLGLPVFRVGNPDADF